MMKGEIMKARRLLVALLAAFMCLGAFTLVACSNPEEQIKAAVEAEFESIKTGEAAAMEEVAEGFDSASGGALDELGVTTDEFLAAYLDGFDYNVGEVTMDGNDKAVVSMTVTMKSISQWQDIFTEELNTWAADLTNYSSMEEAYAAAGQIMVDTLKETPVAETEPFDFTLVKNGDVWEPDANAEASFSNAIMSL